MQNFYELVGELDIWDHITQRWNELFALAKEAYYVKSHTALV